MRTPFRLCEYQSRDVPWPRETREAIAAAAEDWANVHRLPKPPLSFEGPDGNHLRAEQYVGVVEADGVRVEIYPKLDAALVRDADVDDNRARTVMGHLLWMLESSGYDGLVDGGDASVEDGPESISDLLAWLFARRLRHQLSLGLPQEYLEHHDDLPLVRGSIRFARQATVHFSRPDVIACAWEERSPDTPLARLLRCAVEILLHRVRLPGAAADLRDALAMLDDTATVHPTLALSDATQIRWSRMNVRWRPCHDLAQAVLRGLGREMHAGSTESFVFLLDMNKLFESYCLRWLEAEFGVPVATQVFLGTLLRRSSGAREQYADFLWDDTHGGICIGDAKYKIETEEDWPKIDDLRQLICYGRLACQQYPATTPGGLFLLHPSVRLEAARECFTFDGQRLTLQPVCILKPGKA